MEHHSGTWKLLKTMEQLQRSNEEKGKKWVQYLKILNLRSPFCSE